MALVRVVTITTVREVSEPTIAGTTPAYKPATGLNPAMAAYAIPSGIEKRPVTAPEPKSEDAGLPRRRLRILIVFRVRVHMTDRTSPSPSGEARVAANRPALTHRHLLGTLDRLQSEPPPGRGVPWPPSAAGPRWSPVRSAFGGRVLGDG